MRIVIQIFLSICVGVLVGFIVTIICKHCHVEELTNGALSELSLCLSTLVTQMALRAKKA
jgi:NhaP-type Na+/H+ or K+/H+ antiporter